jgi:hypothetical protein
LDRYIHYAKCSKREETVMNVRFLRLIAVDVAVLTVLRPNFAAIRCHYSSPEALPTARGFDGDAARWAAGAASSVASSPVLGLAAAFRAPNLEGPTR